MRVLTGLRVEHPPKGIPPAAMVVADRKPVADHKVQTITYYQLLTLTNA